MRQTSVTKRLVTMCRENSGLRMFFVLGILFYECVSVSVIIMLISLSDKDTTIYNNLSYLKVKFS